MTRMTGRRETRIKPRDQGKLDVMRSMRYVKGNIAMNIDMGRTRRQKAAESSLLSSGSYDYDLKIVKPGQKGLADFGVGQGRKGLGQRGRAGTMKTESCYGYQHY